MNHERRVLLAALASLPLVSASRSLMAESGQGPLVLGIFPRRNAKITNTLFRPLVDHLAGVLNRPVELVTAKDFASFWRGVEERRYDIVHFNQFHYLKARRQHGYRVVARNEELGSDVIAGALYVRNDSPLRRIEELRDRKVVFGGDRSAMMSYIVPTFLLREAGLQPGDYEEAFAVSPPNAVFAAYYQQTDAAGAGDVLARLPMVTNAINVEELRFLAISEPLPHLPWAIRDDLADDLQSRITQVLLGLAESDEGRHVLNQAKLSALRPVTDSDYDPIERMVSRVLGAGALD